MFIHPVNIIILLSMLLGALLLKGAYSSIRNKRKAALAGAAASPAAQNELRALKERVQVLERIAVEQEDSLEREIEKLRDK